MSDRKDLTYGPMLAHTTSTTLRIWLRAGTELRGEHANVKCNLMNGSNIVETQFFNFLPDYDFVSLIEFGKLNHLEPDTTYRYMVEYTNVDGQSILLHEDFAKTFSDDAEKEISFVAGSCRHLYVGSNPNAGWEDWDSLEEWDGRDMLMYEGDDPSITKYGDLVFQKIEENTDINPDFMLMTGDQIYADHSEGTAFKFGSAKSIEDFQDNYYRAWGQEYFSRLSRKIPIYMTMDDHELINDFSADMILPDLNKKKKLKTNTDKYRNGLRSYNCYQASLSSVIKNPENLEDELEILSQVSYETTELNKTDTPYRDHSKNLHYKFSHGCAEFFSMDVRTERYMKIDHPQMIGQKQMNDLKKWLDTVSEDKVKFIITAVPIFPDTRFLFGAAHDKWGGFAEQRYEILEYIRNKRIKKVVFLSGDVHVSLAAKLQYEDDNGVLSDTGIYSIISSAFTWPVPGLSRYNFSWKNLAEESKTVKKVFSKKIKKRIPDAETRGKYKPVQISKNWKNVDDPHANNTYCHIKTDGNSFTYSFFSRDTNIMYDGGQPINFD